MRGLLKIICKGSKRKLLILAANAVILHIVANMTVVINEMKVGGYKISPEMLNALSPYHTSHLNRFGVFPLTGNREKLRVGFK
ncbi:TPA: Tn3 family transposase, partial [Legionella anisa]